MFSLIRSIVSTTIDDNNDSNTETLCRSLRASEVPVSTEDCRSCAEPCDLGHDAYPKRFDVDFSSNMVGSVKPYNRQVVISTGQNNWSKDILTEKDSLAALLSHVSSNPPPPALELVPTPSNDNTNNIPTVPSSTMVQGTPKPKIISPSSSKAAAAATASSGIFSSSEHTRTSILNGSHRSLSHDSEHYETVLVFPDFKCVSEVPRTSQGALELWETSVRPSASASAPAPSLGTSNLKKKKAELKTWVIPYACVILLCSHKNRDNRCGISAPKLQNAFTKALEAKGWDIHTELDHPSLHFGSALEDITAADEDQEKSIEEDQLKQATLSQRALIINVSHFGGHKYAGNAVIYNPAGSGVWYGRVTTHDVDSIVDNTIIRGLVLPPLLRGGVNLTRPNCSNRTLNDW